MTLSEQTVPRLPLVSIVIPTYNYGHFVVDAIDSALAQAYPNCEIIVVDDGSTDSTKELISGRTDIIYMYQSNQGLSAARNAGMKAARGKYLQFLDADDLLGHDSIIRRVEFLEQHPEFSFVVCRNTIFKGMSPRRWPSTKRHEWQLPNPKTLDLSLCYANIAPVHAFLLRKDIVDQLQLRFDTSLRACEDYDFWMRLAVRSSSPGLITNCRVYTRWHPTSMSKSYTNQFRHDAILCQRVLALFECEPRWLGNRPHIDYRTAMLASSFRIARKLWQLDPESFSPFFSRHVLSLSKGVTPDVLSRRPDIAIYRAIIRLNAFRMRFNYGAIDDKEYAHLAQRFHFNSSYFGRAGLTVLRSGRVRECFRLFLYDLHFLALASLGKHILPRKEEDGGQHPNE